MAEFHSCRAFSGRRLGDPMTWKILRRMHVSKIAQKTLPHAGFTLLIRRRKSGTVISRRGIL
jgi:hypothetical protein